MTGAGLSILAIALVDRHFEENFSFGFLYLFPMLVVGRWLKPWQIIVVAALCTALTEAFDPFTWNLPVGMSRLLLSFAACCGAGFHRYELARSRRAADLHLNEVEQEAEARRGAEEQLAFLVANSPASILTLDAEGKILLANGAAHRLLGVARDLLPGQLIALYFPALANVPSSAQAPVFHTEMECRGRRYDGDIFPAHVWFSTYQTRFGPRLAAVVSDTSDELRDRTEVSLRQVMTGSRVLVGALCHEIRNICGAIGVVHAKLARDRELAAGQDFKVLGSMVEGLEKMAGMELRQTTRFVATSIDPGEVLDELRIVVEPAFQDAELTLRWELPQSVPRVWADHQALLQAFLNLARNSQRALEGRAHGVLTIRFTFDADHAMIRFVDNGPGVTHPAELFEPFQPGAQASGLGLYISRAFVRAFHGDIEHEPQSEGCCFAVRLTLAAAPVHIGENEWMGGN